jgi:pimeloyl-ACP methyl ester carboxylesterase
VHNGATYHPPQLGRETVVLLSTLIAGAWVWDRIVPILRYEGYGCLVISDPYAGEHNSIEQLVAQLARLMDEHGIGGAALVGASLGSLVAMDFALAQPKRVTSITISGASTRERPELGIVNTGKVTLPNAVHIAHKLVRDFSCLGDGVVERTFAYFRTPSRLTNLIRLLRESSAYDSAARLAKLTCDVLMIWGEDDEISRCKDWERIAPRARRGSFVRIPRCGHSPMVEKPDEFGAALLTHLAAVARVNPSMST